MKRLSQPIFQKAQTGLSGQGAGNKNKPPLLFRFFANVRSLANKMDGLTIQVEMQRFAKDSCVLISVESWLQPSITDATIEIASYAQHQHGRSRDSSTVIAKEEAFLPGAGEEHRIQVWWCGTIYCGQRQPEQRHLKGQMGIQEENTISAATIWGKLEGNPAYYILPL